jgi:DNA replication protein DnaC
MAQAVRTASAAIAESTNPKVIKTEPNWDWQWRLTGAETAPERVIVDDMLRNARQFIADIVNGAEPRWLVLVGESGCGKTYLAERIVAWLKIYGRGVYTRERERLKRNGVSSFWLYAQAGPFMCRWSRLLGQLRSGEYHRLDVAAEDWFKAIDDLGTDALGADGEATQFAVSKMGDLLDRRLRKWTVITTNFSRKQIAEKFDVRIASRLMRHGSVIVDATGLRDYGLRLEAAKEAA